jgi:hypothetical protein
VLAGFMVGGVVFGLIALLVVFRLVRTLEQDFGKAGR